MNICRVTCEEYKKIVPDRKVFFNEPDFCELNKDKVDEIYYLIVMKENSARFGLILGRSGNMMKCPFSAPYSYPVTIKEHTRVKDYDEALDAIEEYCKEQKIENIRFIFPPLFYDEHCLSAWVSAFYRKKYDVANLDISYAIDLQKFNVEPEEYGKMVPEKGRKGLRKALKMNLTVQKCETEDTYRKAYELIKINHEAKGFPVKMTYDQLRATLNIVDHDVFIVKIGDIAVLSEFLYKVTPDTIQGIYCGVHPDYTEYNSMNFLTYYTIRYYGDKEYKILDKATATENSIPNYGLCDFKDSVGCKRSLKYTFEKNL